jgi:hypothetical protein
VSIVRVFRERGAKWRGDCFCKRLMTWCAFELVDEDPLLEHNALLADELRLLFSAEDEAFLFKS